ncbi:MAG: hypothetical protein IJI57_13245 [Flexilinea sp.]|nr:hypothetical protein [Flexilinea sp.]
METASNGAVVAGTALGAIIATLGIFAIVFGIAWYILQVIAYWKIFTKAGKPGWHSIIPILNEWDRTDLSWSSTWAWVMIACVLLGSVLSSLGTTVNADGETVTTFVGTLGSVMSLAGAVIALISEYKLAKAFGKGFGFFLGLVFLNPIFKMILGFGDAQYQGRQG